MKQLSIRVSNIGYRIKIPNTLLAAGVTAALPGFQRLVVVPGIGLHTISGIRRKYTSNVVLVKWYLPGRKSFRSSP
ncbi:hypothetical protein M011DRAFT_448801 [Sporormia fimetaria CBS 119925]|uniref:Uncharacterized protein n=1 Tax=Sporormia fimetaria CBS 119925 TaxID=1340428 RepID=A0A6A6V241_9PLEO|nr:hypothetical protein M011DRAFT_448801 [Sporormia fimetaria CBS 119925]